MRIAIDVMGGDVDPGVLTASALRCAEDHEELDLELVGDREAIERALEDSVQPGRVHITHASAVVTMEDRPSAALRSRTDSSMRISIDKVRTGEADACVSTGNTGALMAISRHVLKTLPGIDRPAIIKAIPSARGRCHLLDLGANINCDENNLVQFAVMGSLMCGAVEEIERPSVGLLNIGAEGSKGVEVIKRAAERLQANRFLNFIGFVEGDAIYRSGADVVVCDGWVGNVALKTSEGLARFVAGLIEESFEESIAGRTAALIANPVLQRLRNKLSPDRYNGATMLGLQGIVVKSHGNTTAEGFYHAIVEAMREVALDIPKLIETRVHEILSMTR